ncbi:hypothetical protein RhiirA5_411561 [Rhizophagus irregularis]|uniref:Uncharacterized protein n=1 Tax=Rhizophagus irregularis TaxID=588596 RepID=A0A2N0Q0P7_9GLOM|nr:hypothetical protein RhiirA5_411561 [Rhizophagus irregularis]
MLHLFISCKLFTKLYVNKTNMGKSKKHYKKCTANKSVIKKPKIVYTLNDIIFKNCDELERHKKLKEHTHFLEVINETTVRCVCNKKVKLDKSYRAHNLDNHSKSSFAIL